MTWQGGKRAREPNPVASPFARLSPLMAAPKSDVAEAFQSLAQALRNYDSPVRINVRLVSGQDGESVDHWVIEGGTASATAQRVTNGPKDADVIVVMRPETWVQIAQGQLAPYEALFAGRLRVGGDLEAAKRITKHLSNPSATYVSPC